MVNDFPENIMQILRLRHGLNRFDVSNDEEIKKSSKSSAFNDVLCWNGIIGWDRAIKGYVKDIYGVDLDNMSDGLGRKRYNRVDSDDPIRTKFIAIISLD